MIDQGTEDDLVVGARRAAENGRGLILGVAVGIWAHLFKEDRVVSGAAIAYCVPGAAIFVLVEHRACVVTAPRRLQLAWAL